MFRTLTGLVPRYAPGCKWGDLIRSRYGFPPRDSSGCLLSSCLLFQQTMAAKASHHAPLQAATGNWPWGHPQLNLQQLTNKRPLRRSHCHGLRQRTSSTKISLCPENGKEVFAAAVGSTEIHRSPEKSRPKFDPTQQIISDKCQRLSN